MTGHATAMEDVSRMYEKGQGLKQDMVEAAFWRRLIEINFPSEESSHLPNIFARSASPDYQLTKEQNAEIEKRVEAWRPVGDPCNSVPVPPVPSDEPSRLSFSGLKKILHLSR